MSRHCVHNALYQSKLPLSDMVHGANRMCPPESLHVMDAGITMYMQESLESRISKGRSMAELDSLQNRMFHAIRRSSERDFPRGTTRSGIVGTTRCQSSERKGNLFLLLCVAHTADGRLILQFELDYSKKQYDRWLDLLKLYLAMEEWFHDARDKEEVELARELVADIITQVQEYFPRTEDSHGYKLPKMHALAKMIDYICLYGSAINFYGGPGEASHKSFVKAPGLKTQRRVSEFAAQVAGQYYNMMVTRKACNYVDIGLTSDRVDETNYRARNNSKDEQYSVEGRYTVDIFADGSIRLTATKNKSLKKHGLHMVLVRALRKLATDEGNTGAHRFEGYTRATVKGNDGESATYNAHPHFHGGPWYDWAYVYYEIETEFETVAEYYPSKIFGFIKDESDDVHAIIQCSKKHLPWDQVEEEFVVKFELCSEEGSEQIVPLSALNNPICVVQDYGSNNADDYLMILPKGQWSEYFGSWVHD